MKKIAFLIFILGVSLQANAQNWQTDFEQSKKIASEKHLPIILVFQGSDWCAPCIKLNKEVWSSEDFKSYSKDHFVMLQADFPRKKKNALEGPQEAQNKMLAEKYNKQGVFPFVVVLDANGKVLGETGYNKMSPKQYIDHLNAFVK